MRTPGESECEVRPTRPAWFGEGARREQKSFSTPGVDRECSVVLPIDPFAPDQFELVFAPAFVLGARQARTVRSG